MGYVELKCEKYNLNLNNNYIMHVNTFQNAPNIVVKVRGPIPIFAC